MQSRSNMECGGLCLSQASCSAFAWDMSSEVCQLAQIEKLGGPDRYPLSAYVDASKNLCKFKFSN